MPRNLPANYDNWQQPRQNRYLRRTGQQPYRPGQSPPPVPIHAGANFPPPANPYANFLPATPAWEASQRAANDALSSQLMGIGVARDQVPLQLNVANQRALTDRGYANQQLDENLADRGIYDSGSNMYLRNRDINLPYGRGLQDRTLGAEQQLSGLSQQESEARLQYQQALVEALLQRAQFAAQNMPMELPQYSRRRVNN